MMDPYDAGANLRDKLNRLQQLTGQAGQNHELIQEIRQELERMQFQVSWLSQNQQTLDERVRNIERSMVFQTLRWIGAQYFQIRSFAGQLLLHSPLHPLYFRLTGTSTVDLRYREWVSYETSLFPSREECIARIAAWDRKPLISVAMAVHNPKLEWLREAIASVTDQIYPDWQLCICDDASTDPAVKGYLDEIAGTVGHVALVRHDSAKGISGALNSAAALAQGEYVGFLDHDDTLSPHALFHVVEALQKREAVVLYSDEDKLDETGERVEPQFKPAWSDELLLSLMYMAHFLVVSRKAFESTGGFRSDYDGAQDFDLALRLTELPDAEVVHIPRILYHWRKHPNSTSTNAHSKPYAHLAGTQALTDALRRRQWAGEIEDGPFRHTYRIKQPLDSDLVSIVLCSRSPRLLERALLAVKANTSGQAYELILAEHCPYQESPEMERLAKTYNCQRIPVYGPFNFSKLNNLAAAQAQGKILVFLNDDVEPLSPDWLVRLTGHFKQQGIGVVGGKLLYPSGTIQHAGIAIGIGDGAAHINRNRHEGVYWRWTEQARNVSAVTGACLAIRTEVFRHLGGFDTTFPNNYNDVDLCLRVQREGYRVVYEPAAILRHDEAQTRDVYVNYQERERFYLRWANRINRGDPYYNPNLSRSGEDAPLNFAVRQQDLAPR